jgi:ABC-type glycerol-3-phosphate transport system substrate-binding protein
MHRRSSLSSLLVCLSLLLAACGGAAPQTPNAGARTSPAANASAAATTAATAAAPEGDPAAGADISKTIVEIPVNPTIKAQGNISLDVWMAADYYQTKPVQAVFAAFQQAYPNVKLNVSGYEWGDMQNQVKLAVGTGTAPCVSHGHPYAMGAQGFAEDLTDLWNAWQQTDTFMDSAIQDVTWKERVYGVPLDINTLFTIYNKELFKNAGVAEPNANWSFQDARDAARKLTKDGVYGTVISASSWAMSGMVVANGTNLLKTEDKQIKANLDDPRVIEVLTTLSELGHKEQVSPIPPQTPRQTDAPVAIFGAEKAAFFFSGPWDLARIRKEARPGLIEKVGTAPLPNGMNGQTDGSVLGGGSLWIPKGCRHKEVTFELLKWFTTNSYQMSMVQDQARYPVIAELYNTSYLQNDTLAQPFYEQLKTAAPYALEPYADAAKAWNDSVRAAMDGGNPAELLKQAQATAQAAIDQAEGQ